jgi:hypothetical protein
MNIYDFLEINFMASSLNANHPWFEICHPRPAAKYQVFIFPSAGTAGILFIYNI